MKNLLLQFIIKIYLTLININLKLFKPMLDFLINQEPAILKNAVIKNLTPHPINLYLPNGEIVTYQPENKENPARAKMEVREVIKIEINNQLISINNNTYGELENVPPPQANVFYIVSSLAAQAAPLRKDLLIPSDPVRDDEGKIIGCKSFSII
jgi:hypothetical protein